LSIFFSKITGIFSVWDGSIKSAEQKPRFGGLKSNFVKEFSFQSAMDEYINWLSEQDKGAEVCL
jgi:hypothetical protein